VNMLPASCAADILSAEPFRKHRTPNTEDLRAGEPSAFDVQRSMFDVSNATGETPVPLPE